MRIITFLLAFFCITHIYSQVDDDFSDGDFTDNPAWDGDIGKFRVDTKGQLRLDDGGKTGEAWLSTPSGLLRGAEWEFYVRLMFNTSANNYALFYLAADAWDLSGDAYVVAIGGAGDNLRLLKVSGGTMETLVEGEEGRIDNSSPELYVRVRCDEAGRWTLSSRLCGTENVYADEGSAADSPDLAVSHAGLRCIYTSSRNAAFVFDDIRIAPLGGQEEPDDPGEPEVPDEPGEPDEPVEPDIPDPDDVLPPSLVAVEALSSSSLQVTFDEPVDVGAGSFAMDGIGEAVSRKAVSERSLLLSFATEFEDSETYYLLVSGVCDKAGNVMRDTQVSFVYYDPELQAVGFGDVVFNEIMANPVDAAGLPEVEYVELYNRMERPVSLNHWTFHYGNRSYEISGGWVPAGGYAVLCHVKHVDKWEDVVPVGVKSFPELANTGKMLWLEDARANLIAWVEYSDDWYADEFKEDGGFSLECVDVSNLANDSANWKVSVDPSGGTPGRANSVRGECTDVLEPEIAYAYFHAPDTLVVRFTKPMLPSSLSVADHYTVYSGDAAIAVAIPAVPDAKQVSLVLADSLQQGDVFEVELQDVEDISGYPLSGRTSVRLGLPEQASPGDVRFNEILFNPASGGSDYVELYNVSDKYVDLSSLFFTSRKEDGAYAERSLLSDLPVSIAPAGYFCFTEDRSAVLEQHVCEAPEMLWEIGDLPSLPDDGGNIVLTDAEGMVVDEMSYTEKMHTALLKDPEGISLEKINPVLSSLQSGSWASASTSSGGGTPGYANSQYRDLPDDTSESFWLENDSFSPDGDGVGDELVIGYSMPATDTQADIRIYDASGRLVRLLAENYRLEAQGVFVWDGCREDGTLVRWGIYIIYVEVHAPSGKRERYKMACAVTG